MKNSSLFIILQRMRKPFLVITITHAIAIIGFLIIDGIDANGKTYNLTIFDAFYFVTYTATTIGFGELPYEFTYAQRIWATISIYLTVIGWFYGVGTLITLLQDKLFLREIKKSKFKRQIKNLKQKFIIILGYNQTTKEIINKTLEQGIRAVVIEKDENKANELILESYTPSVPILVADVHSAQAIAEAGIKKFNCKGLISIFEDDSLNLRIALTSKLLNKNVKLAVKSTSIDHTENLVDLDVEIIANPFAIISSEINMALNAPNLLKLERWVYQIDNLVGKLPVFPKGKYIICGYGRMGEYFYGILKQNKLKANFIEINKTKVSRFITNDDMGIINADADDKDSLLEAGILEADAIISATNKDTTNLSILATAKKLNPNIMAIVRENEMDDFSIFENAKVDHIFMPSRILINKTTNAMIYPISDKFIRMICNKDESWASKLVKDLMTKIGENPLLFELKIDKNNTPQIFNAIENSNEIKLELFSRSLYNREHHNNVIPLLLKRDGKNILLPDTEELININDDILFACDENGKSDIEYISQNLYEFHYAYTGKENETIFFRKNK